MSDPLERFQEIVAVAPIVLAEAVRLIEDGKLEAAVATLREFERVCRDATRDSRGEA